MSYTINLTDPLFQTITIADGDTDTSLPITLHGRNAQEWGENVNQTILRLLQQFISATPPLNPIHGMIWAAWFPYYKDTSLPVSAGWFKWDTATNAWLLMSPQPSTPTPPPIVSVGSHYFDGTELYMWESQYGEQPLNWMTRLFSESDLGGNAPTSPPLIELRMWDASVTGWTAPTSFSSLPKETNPFIGSSCINPDGRVEIYTQSGWVVIPGVSNVGVTTELSRDLDANGYQIVNVGAPTNPTDLANKQYVDNLISAINSGQYSSASIAQLFAQIQAISTKKAIVNSLNQMYPNGGVYINDVDTSEPYQGLGFNVDWSQIDGKLFVGTTSPAALRTTTTLGYRTLPSNNASETGTIPDMYVGSMWARRHTECFDINNNPVPLSGSTLVTTTPSPAPSVTVDVTSTGVTNGAVIVLSGIVTYNQGGVDYDRYVINHGVLNAGAGSATVTIDVPTDTVYVFVGTVNVGDVSFTNVLETF